jgi:hypothetical protein
VFVCLVGGLLLAIAVFMIEIAMHKPKSDEQSAEADVEDDLQMQFSIKDGHSARELILLIEASQAENFSITRHRRSTCL